MAEEASACSQNLEHLSANALRSVLHETSQKNPTMKSYSELVQLTQYDSSSISDSMDSCSSEEDSFHSAEDEQEAQLSLAQPTPEEGDPPANKKPRKTGKAPKKSKLKSGKKQDVFSLISSEEEWAALTAIERRERFLNSVIPAERVEGVPKGSHELKRTAKYVELAVARTTAKRLTFYPRGLVCDSTP